MVAAKSIWPCDKQNENITEVPRQPLVQGNGLKVLDDSISTEESRRTNPFSRDECCGTSGNGQKGWWKSKTGQQRQSLPNLDPSPETSHDEAGSRSGGDSDDELNSADSAKDDENKPRPAMQKQLSSSHDGLTRKKHRRQRRPLSKPYRQCLKSYSPVDQCSRVAMSSTPAPSMQQSIDVKMSLGDSNLSPSSRATPPTLTEIVPSALRTLLLLQGNDLGRL